MSTTRLAQKFRQSQRWRKRGHLSIPLSYGLIPAPIGKKMRTAIVRRMAMREGNALRMMSPTGSILADDAHGSIAPMRRNSFLRSVASASEDVAHLGKRAMTFLETNRETARCCQRDASTLLGLETEESVIDAPKQYTCRPSGLATWQPERVLDCVEANLGLKVA